MDLYLVVLPQVAARSELFFLRSAPIDSAANYSDKPNKMCDMVSAHTAADEIKKNCSTYKGEAPDWHLSICEMNQLV